MNVGSTSAGTVHWVLTAAGVFWRALCPGEEGVKEPFAHRRGKLLGVGTPGLALPTWLVLQKHGWRELIWIRTVATEGNCLEPRLGELPYLSTHPSHWGTKAA